MWLQMLSDCVLKDLPKEFVKQERGCSRFKSIEERFQRSAEGREAFL
jgi:hypothetical protein